MANENVFYEQFIEKAKHLFGAGFIPLHRPVFEGTERQYLIDCIDSTDRYGKEFPS